MLFTAYLVILLSTGDWVSYSAHTSSMEECRENVAIVARSYQLTQGVDWGHFTCIPGWEV